MTNQNTRNCVLESLVLNIGSAEQALPNQDCDLFGKAIPHAHTCTEKKSEDDQSKYQKLCPRITSTQSWIDQKGTT